RCRAYPRPIIRQSCQPGQCRAAEAGGVERTLQTDERLKDASISVLTLTVHPSRRHSGARSGANPESRWPCSQAHGLARGSWIPGSACGGPGMTDTNVGTRTREPNAQPSSHAIKDCSVDAATPLPTVTEPGPFLGEVPE